MSLTPLSAPPGLNSDETTFASGGQWTDGSGVRFKEGRPQTIEGSFHLGDLPGGTECTDLYATHVAHAYTVIYGTLSKVYATTGSPVPSGAADISPAGFLGVGDAGCAFDNFGSEVLFCPSGGTLYKYTGSGIATEVAQAPDRITDMLVTNERQVLAFGCNEEISTDYNPLCIRGSDLEDYTNWTTSSTNNAFEHILDGMGSIIAARRIGQYVAVWSTAALHLGQFIGNPSQAYRFDLVDQVPGPTSRSSVCVLDGTAYWLGTDLQMHAWMPGALPTVVPCPISGDFQANYDIGLPETDRMIIVPVYDEIWFFYTDTRDGNTGLPSRYIAYSPRESAAAQRPVWFRGSMTRSALCSGPAASLLGGKLFSWLAANGTSIYRQGDTAGSGSGASYGPFSLTLGDIYLSNGQQRAMIRSFRPDFSGQVGDISVTVNVRDHPQSTPVTKGPYTISPGDTKKDFRASGMIASFTFSSSDDPCAFRIGKPTIDVVPMGAR